MEVKWFIILAITALLAFFIGFILGRRKKKPKYDGQLIIGSIEDREQFQFIFETELEDLKKQPTLIMEIIHSQK
jgi:LPXTG-motif cell wall-anchored protein